MADPKYADLPGIAYDQPDVYETNDLPEADQGNDFYEEENDSIERLHISASEAFNKFKGKYLNANRVDFSERLSRKIRTGYDARSGDWELVAEGEKETPLQKYQRLKCEMQELLEEVAQIKESVKENEEPECANIAVSVEQVLKQLSDLRLEEAFGSELINNLSDPQGAQLAKLLVQLEQFKKSSTEKPASVTSKVTDSTEKDIITYQLKYRPEYAKLTQTCRVTDLEQRLHRLEIALGTSSDKFSRLTAATNQNSLMEAAQLLSAKSSMLDSAQLDHIEGRLTALTQKMNTLAQQRAATAEDSEKDLMISELYTIVKKTESMSELLPQTIERMIALEALYQQALDFNKSLMQLEALQGQISAGVQNNKSLLQGVQESFALNLDTIQKNILSLDARVKALKK